MKSIMTMVFMFSILNSFAWGLDQGGEHGNGNEVRQVLKKACGKGYLDKGLDAFYSETDTNHCNLFVRAYTCFYDANNGGLTREEAIQKCLDISVRDL